MSVIHQLFKPLAYVRIKHPTKAFFDWWLPLFFAIATWCFLYYVVKSPALFGENGLIIGVNELLQVLVGFYIAGLAAIATFQNPGMDDQMSGDPVTLEEQYRGQTLLVGLTRRRFLCYLFGYLSWISLTLYFIGVLANISKSAIASMILPTYLSAVKFGFLFLYLLVLSNLFITTMLGLYYMSHRLHLTEPKDTTADR